MRNFILVLFSSLGLTFSTAKTAFAIEFRPYWGLSLQVDSTTLQNDSYNEEDVFGANKSTRFGVGIGVGLRAKLQKFYLGGEIFLTKNSLLHEWNLDDDGIKHEQEEVKIYSLLNTKIHFGYDYTNRLTFFGSLGLRHIEYESTYAYFDYNVPGSEEFIKFNKSFLAPTYGIGLGYFLSQNCEVRLGYERTSLKVIDRIFSLPNIEGKVNLTIDTLKIGLNYMF